jgi:hypothetical protein
MRDERLSPSSDTDRLRVQFQQRISPTLELALGGHAERTRYRNGAAFGLTSGRDRLNVLDAFTRLTARLRRDLLLHVEADYYDSKGQTNSQLTRLGLGLQGSFRSLDFSIEGRHSVFMQEKTNGDRDTLTFNIKRRF